MKLIDKDSVVTEIKRYKRKIDERLKIKGRTLAEDCKDSALQNLCGNLLYFIDTLEAKEVDLEKYYQDFLQKEWFDKNCNRTISEMMVFTAKHFFELGVNTQK